MYSPSTSIHPGSTLTLLFSLSIPQDRNQTCVSKKGNIFWAARSRRHAVIELFVINTLRPRMLINRKELKKRNLVSTVGVGF